MSIKVYHGTNIVVDSPDCKVGRKALDFGQGFYVTDIKEQAKGWATRIADNRGGESIINSYTLDRDTILKEERCKIFTAYDEEWLEFIVRNRQSMEIEEYDYIEGGVADDRIIDTVRLYMLGLMPLDVALQRLIMHQPNNQICLRCQLLIDKNLTFDGAEYI